MTDQEYYEVFKKFLPEKGFLMASEMIHIQGIEATADKVMEVYAERGFKKKESFRKGLIAFLRHLKKTSETAQ